MHRITLTVFLLFSATAADAAWYQKWNDGTIVDPIQSINGDDLSYYGNNIEPYADLSGADLTDADLNWAKLWHADLTDADLTGAYLHRADLWEADLSGADLTDADLNNADVYGADLTGANLSGSILTSLQSLSSSGSWAGAFYYTDNEPTWDIDTDAAWRSSEGILALAPTSAVHDSLSPLGPDAATA